MTGTSEPPVLFMTAQRVIGWEDAAGRTETVYEVNPPITLQGQVGRHVIVETRMALGYFDSDGEKRQGWLSRLVLAMPTTDRRRPFAPCVPFDGAAIKLPLREHLWVLAQVDRDIDTSASYGEPPSRPLSVLSQVRQYVANETEGRGGTDFARGMRCVESQIVTLYRSLVADG